MTEFVRKPLVLFVIMTIISYPFQV
jgi:hypothetical protein